MRIILMFLTPVGAGALRLRYAPLSAKGGKVHNTTKFIWLLLSHLRKFWNAGEHDLSKLRARFLQKMRDLTGTNEKKA